MNIKIAHFAGQITNYQRKGVRDGPHQTNRMRSVALVVELLFSFLKATM